MGCICAPVLLFGTIFLSGRCKPRASWRGKGSYSSVLSLDGFWCVVVWTFPDCKTARIPAECSKILNMCVCVCQPDAIFPDDSPWFGSTWQVVPWKIQFWFLYDKTWGNGSWMSILLIGHCEMSLMTCLVWWILLQNPAELESWKVILYTEKGVGNIKFVNTPQTQFWGGLVRICGMLWSQWCLMVHHDPSDCWGMHRSLKLRYIKWTQIVYFRKHSSWECCSSWFF